MCGMASARMLRKKGGSDVGCGDVSLAKFVWIAFEMTIDDLVVVAVMHCKSRYVN